MLLETSFILQSSVFSSEEEINPQDTISSIHVRNDGLFNFLFDNFSPFLSSFIKRIQF